MDLQDERWHKIQQYCVYQERSQQEVRYKMVALGYRGDELEEALAQLISENFVNESRFASLYAISKLRHNHWGKVKIKNHLKAKGISDYTIREAMYSINVDEYVSILHKVVSKYESTHHLLLHKPKDLQRLNQYLLQKGFAYEDINSLLKERKND